MHFGHVTGHTESDSSLPFDSPSWHKLTSRHYVTQSGLSAECFRSRRKSTTAAWHPEPAAPPGRLLLPLLTSPCWATATCALAPHELQPILYSPIVPVLPLFQETLKLTILGYRAACPPHIRPSDNATSGPGVCTHAVPSTWKAVLLFLSFPRLHLAESSSYF